MDGESGPHWRSNSQLEDFLDCGEAFRLKRIVRPRPPKVEAAWFHMGTAVHYAYELWELSRRRHDPVEDFQKEYDRLIEEAAERVPDLSTWMKTPNVKSTQNDVKLRRAEGARQIEEYTSSALWEGWRLLSFSVESDPDEDRRDEKLALELPFEIMLGRVPVRGKIDSVIEYDDGKIVLRDLKTGSKQKKTGQLGLYAYALRAQYGVSVDEAEFWYLKRGTSSGPIDTSPYTETFLTSIYESLDSGIDAGIFIPNPSDLCDWACPVRQWCREKGSTPIEIGQ